MPCTFLLVACPNAFYICLLDVCGSDFVNVAIYSKTELMMKPLTNVWLVAGWGQTVSGMSAVRPNNASTVSTAFIARKVHTIAIGGPGKRSMWQRMGLEPTTLSLPVFQYYPEDKACSVWLYETDKSTAPHQKLTWFGVKSLADGQTVLEGDQVSYPKYGNSLYKQLLKEALTV